MSSLQERKEKKKRKKQERIIFLRIKQYRNVLVDRQTANNKHNTMWVSFLIKQLAHQNTIPLQNIK